MSVCFKNCLDVLKSVARNDYALLICRERGLCTFFICRERCFWHVARRIFASFVRKKIARKNAAIRKVLGSCASGLGMSEAASLCLLVSVVVCWHLLLPGDVWWVCGGCLVGIWGYLSDIHGNWRHSVVFRGIWAGHYQNTYRHNTYVHNTYCRYYECCL